MKIIFDDEYENVDKDISTMKKYDKNNIVFLLMVLAITENYEL